MTYRIAVTVGLCLLLVVALPVRGMTLGIAGVLGDASFHNYAYWFYGQALAA